MTARLVCPALQLLGIVNESGPEAHSLLDLFFVLELLFVLGFVGMLMVCLLLGPQRCHSLLVPYTPGDSQQAALGAHVYPAYNLVTRTEKSGGSLKYDLGIL